MAYNLIVDFRAGQDDRRSDVAAPTGTLRQLTNAHITRGGEIEKRKAMSSKYALPADTFGMAATADALYVFGSAAAPAAPAGVTYQRLEHPTAQAMTAVKSVDVYDGKLYVAAEYADDSIHHFYDGTRVADWADGLARGSFDVTGGSASTAASTTFDVTGGTSNPGTNQVTSITVGGAEVLGTAVDWATSHSDTATAIAAQITTTSNGWVATASGPTVTITSETTGTDDNGDAVVITVAGDVTASAAADTAGGTLNGVTAVRVNGVEALGSTVKWATSNSGTATLIAAAIEAYVSSPEYSSTAVGAQVNIVSDTTGTGPNGYVVEVDVAGNLTVGDVQPMAGGADSSTVFTPGEFVRTYRTKLYSTSGSRLHFSALDDPTAWQTSDLGAGYINMSSQASGSEELMSIAAYYNFLAIFSRKNVQVWTVDPDPELNAQVQVLRNTGTYAPRSVESFGDSDVVYLSRTGVRSLRARDSSNAANVSEIGAPLDSTIIAYAATLTAAQREAAVAVVEPIDNRYWVAIGGKVFVLSLFSASKIAAWSEYDFGFSVSDFAVLDDRVYARSGDTIYLFGGDDNDVYDDSVVTVILPFADADAPATFKELTGIDATVDGEWRVYAAFNPKQPTVFEDLGAISGPTWGEPADGAQGESTHFKFKLTHEKAEYARIANLAFHFEPTAAG